MNKILLFLFFVVFLSCAEADKEKLLDIPKQTANDSIFNKEKWKIMEKNTYVYRKYMMNDIVYNDTIRSLNKSQILHLLGEPDRVTNNHIYYMINETRLLFWPLHTTMIVFKFTDDNKVKWLKIHK